jgi:hypothetical protein
MRVRGAEDRNAGFDGEANLLVAETSRSGKPFVSSAIPSSSATSITRSSCRAFGGRWLMMRPFGWLRQRAAGCRIASTTLRVRPSASWRCPAWSESCTDSRSCRRARAVDQEAAPPRALPRESGKDLSLGLGSDPLHVAQPACFGSGAQLVGRPDPELPTECGDGRPCLTDQLRSTPVGAHGVVAGSCEIEEGGVHLEHLRDLSVAHAG